MCKLLSTFVLNGERGGGGEEDRDAQPKFCVLADVHYIFGCRPSGTEDVVRVYAEADTQVC